MLSAFKVKPKVRIRFKYPWRYGCTSLFRPLTTTPTLNKSLFKKETTRSLNQANQFNSVQPELDKGLREEQIPLKDFPETNDTLQAKFGKHMKQRPVFYDPVEYYSKHVLDSTPNSDSEFPKYPPLSSFKEIVDRNENEMPVVGSLIEFIDPLKRGVAFGLVIKSSDSKFNENYNKLMVLTLDNKIEMVSSCHVNYQHYQALDSEWISQMGIEQDRTKSNLPRRLHSVEVMKSFLNSSMELCSELKDSLDLVHSQYAKNDIIVPISILEIIESLKFSNKQLTFISESYYHQCIILMAIHIIISGSPLWIQSSNIPDSRLTNIIKYGSANSLIYGPDYYLNSISNSQSINQLLNTSRNELLMNDADSFLTNLHYQQQSSAAKSYDDVNFYLTIWEGRNYRYIIDCLKFIIIYPHSQLTSIMQKFAVFKNASVTPSNVYSFLENLKLYNNHQNQLTDIFLSANLTGKPQLSQLALSSPHEIEPINYSKYFSWPNLVDKFPHLRKEKIYYKDHVLYGIPTSPGSTTKSGTVLAVSLEKVNSRRYLINIHIPDIAAKISPSSDMFDQLLSSSTSMKAFTQLVGSETLNELFDEKILRQLRFPSQGMENESDLYRVGDAPIQAHRSGNSGKVTCMTASFTYNTFDSNPFSNLEEKLQFSFDSLHTATIKNVSMDEWEDCLEGKSDASPFRIFQRGPPTSEKTPSTLSNSDKHNIGFIYNVLKSFFKGRNLKGAAAVSPTTNMDIADATEMTKDLSYVNSGSINERLVTDISLSGTAKKFTKFKFFTNEIKSLVARMTSLYCAENKIPIYSHYQSNLYAEEGALQTTETDIKPIRNADSALVCHDNLLLPNYYADSFYQTLISRDANGHVSLPAHIIGRNFLGKQTLQVSTKSSETSHLAMGLPGGYVNVVDVLNDFEAIFNQLQILSFVQLQAYNSYVRSHDSHVENVKRFSYLKGYGYNLRGPFDSATLSQQQEKIINSKRFASFLQTGHKRFWVLKMLEQRLMHEKAERNSFTEGTPYECIITHSGYELPELGNRISRGYCSELNIEVDVLNSTHNNPNIGNIIKCDKVLFLDPVSGACVLKEEQVF